MYMCWIDPSRQILRNSEFIKKDRDARLFLFSTSLTHLILNTVLAIKHLQLYIKQSIPPPLASHTSLLCLLFIGPAYVPLHPFRPSVILFFDFIKLLLRCAETSGSINILLARCISGIGNLLKHSPFNRSYSIEIHCTVLL
jgi:hypothetical protein